MGPAILTQTDFVRALCAAAMAVGLAGCAQQSRETFDLSGAPAAASHNLRKTTATLVVHEPTAVAPVASDRVVVRDQSGAVAVLPGVQWSERLPGLLQKRLLVALERAGASATLGVGVGVALHSDVRRFEIDVARDLAVVEIAARLTDERSGRERKARVFLAESPAPEHTGAAGVTALETAAADAARQIADWARAGL